MSSETITRNDIVAILNKTIPGQGTDMSAQGVEDFIEDLNLAPSDYVKLSELGDYVIEQGTEGNWTYIKWSSGRAELYGAFSQTVSAYAANAFVIGSSAITGYPFPITNPIAMATGGKVATGACHISYDYGRTDYWSGVANPINASIASGTSATIVWYLYVNAKWK